VQENWRLILFDSAAEGVLLFALAVIGGTLVLRRFLLRLGVLDVPSARSSHTSVTPRGGGLVFVVAWMTVALWGLAADLLPPHQWVCIAGLALLAGTSFLDDIAGLPVWIRLIAHVVASVAFVQVWRTPFATTLGIPSSLEWIVIPGLVLSITWMINVTNFMDGIDGLAAMEGVFIAWAIAFLWNSDGVAYPAQMALWGGGAILGFGLVNVSRWRIFMGDVGSVSLGYIVCWLTIAAVCDGNISPWAVAVLPSLFVADATMTLATRMLTGQNPARPHRTHAYQRLATAAGSHLAVVGGYGLLNVLVILPAALLAQRQPQVGPLVVGIVYVVLSIIAYGLRAGFDLGPQTSSSTGHRPRRILFVTTEDWYFASHYLRLACSLKQHGHEIGVATRSRNHATQIREAGCKVYPVPFARGVEGVLAELRGMLWLAIAVLRFRPDVCHHIALKPIVLGTCVVRFLRPSCQVVDAVTGLGGLSIPSGQAPSRASRLLVMALRWALRQRGVNVIVQNPDDAKWLVSNGFVREHTLTLIRGAGVDTTHFHPIPPPSGNITIVLAARMLAAKGVREFVDAAHIIRATRGDVTFRMLGRVDAGSPTALTEQQLRHLCHDGVVEWQGHVDDISVAYNQSHIVCLPSYYGEGVPKSLIEAAACARPIVTTDTAGCREVVHHGVNGLLVPPRDSSALAAALGQLIEDGGERTRMGNAGRQMVMQSFAIEHVEASWAELYHHIFQEQDSPKHGALPASKSHHGMHLSVGSGLDHRAA
jgi:UDP-N-acetylmuramyl pentapeptide phosphotransferase/UDP-N-acetylglucosamine-1-phosphate transferase/glycosyltransferase involved in cell wall biosynthesis